MLMREAAPGLAPGSYLVGVGPEAARLSYAGLADMLSRALEVTDIL